MLRHMATVGIVHRFLKLHLTRSIDLYVEIYNISDYLNDIFPSAFVTCVQQPCEVGYFFHCTGKETYQVVNVSHLVSGGSGFNIRIFCDSVFFTLYPTASSG